jgi:hypothetical protein
VARLKPHRSDHRSPRGRAVSDAGCGIPTLIAFRHGRELGAFPAPCRRRNAWPGSRASPLRDRSGAVSGAQVIFGAR